MLLLVLILVVIAFGLLVVALLSTSVLWAWVSVGVSVVAAVVLLVDWLQRRSAAKAGAMPAVEQAGGAATPMAAPESGFARPAMAAPPRGDLDPATEVLPIVPSSARGGSEPDSPTVMTPAPQQFDAQQTVVMPAVQPSGSPARPSGADPSVTPSSVKSSPNVTKTDVDRSAPAFGTGDQTMAVEPVSTPGRTPAGTGPADADDPETPASSGSEADAPDTDAAPPPEAPAKVGLGKAAAGGVTAAAVGVALTKSGDVDPAPEQSVSEQSASEKSASEPSTAEQPTAENPAPVKGAVVPAASGPGAPEPAGTTSDPDAESTVAVEAHPSTPTDDMEPATPVAEAPIADAGVAPADATRGNAVSAPAEPVDLFAAPVAAAVEPASSGEAPEAPHDPVAAEIVSGLDDEVVVVDEQPRYHVSECRALISVAVIPLPVREAVELGFTPCGWCSPERTLAGRHQTASR